VPIDIQAMKAAILFLDGVNFARSYLSHVRRSIKKNQRSREPKEPILSNTYEV